MILYLDSSALVKRYLRESGSAEVHSLRRSAMRVSSSLVAYAETLAALAIAQRTARITGPEYRRLVAEFQRDWPSMVALDVDRPLVVRAGDLTERHPLRGFDAIHLASALRLQDEIEDAVTFSAFDGRLNEAARSEGLSVP